MSHVPRRRIVGVVEDIVMICVKGLDDRVGFVDAEG